jgi:hypothetical protein
MRYIVPLGQNYFMETIITIKKNKPAFQALVLLAKELGKKDASISVVEKTEYDQDVIAPKHLIKNPFDLVYNLSDYPTLKQLRKKAWPKTL